MDEAQLRLEVLVPLFRAMGFKDVRIWHHPNEKGKDIVMWFPTPMRGREYYAAVVKAEPITGQANTRKGSAGEVFMQLSQALGSPYTDPFTLKKQKISKCYVVTPRAIRPEAADSLEAALSGARIAEGTVEMMDGERLWEKIHEFSPERMLGSHLGFAAALLNELSPDYHVVTHMRGGTIRLGLEPKHSNAPAVNVSAVFEFPSTASGQTAREAFESHIRRGTSVVIPSQFIKDIVLPEPLRPFFESVSEVHLASMSTKVLPASIVAKHGDDEARLRTRFRKIRGGTEEIEIETLDGDGPFKFGVVANSSTRVATVTYRFTGTDSSAKRHLEVARFADVLARGGQLDILDETTGARLFGMSVQAGMSPEPEPGWIEFLEAVTFIQQRCNVQLPLPEQIPRKDATDVIDLATKLQAGIWEGPIVSVALEVKLSPRAPIEQLTSIGPDGTRIARISDEAWFEVFGVRIQLGKAVHVASHMVLAEESRLLLADPDRPKEITVHLTPTSDSRGLVAYTKWLNEAQLADLRSRLPGLGL